jgi:hypothetical protein
MDIGDVFSGVKRANREADHSIPFSAEVWNVYRFISTVSEHFITWGLVTGDF